ncbi:LapA family protein [Sediminicoccus sp. KRV36]|uniref:LapA family protein n=1 Tax=Sediminicoccus sp. KRV36 TaxID=3133721 RepID=UPI00200F57E9|nr:LapA family protein [Sediminicoccus rosea]UPY38735.1 LapA family protein [Sediminicoccus rosea]
MIAYLLPAIFAAALAAFALANPNPVIITFWPEGWVAELPLWQAILGPCLVAFLGGALTVWLAHLPDKRSAAQLRQAAALLDAELASRDPRPAKPR